MLYFPFPIHQKPELQAVHLGSTMLEETPMRICLPCSLVGFVENVSAFTAESAEIRQIVFS